MVKVGCPDYVENVLWDTGLKVGDYYYLLNQDTNQIIQMELETDDGVLFGVNEAKEYKFYDEVLDEVSGSYSIKGKLDISTADQGHQIGRTDYNLVVTSYNEFDGTYPIAVQMINENLEITNSYNRSRCDGVAWDGTRIFILATSDIIIFDNDLNYRGFIGITSNDDSTCVVKDGYLWTGEWWYSQLRKRNVNDLRDVLLNINMPGGIKGLYLWDDYLLVMSREVSSIPNTYFTKLNPDNGWILKQKFYNVDNVENVITLEDTFVFLDKWFSYIVQKDTDLNTIQSNYSTLVGLCKIE
ncbi:MAG: hypothetical protein QHH15_00510 [Candidatus Thermoplasmatota archaeon]|nr:hypothetical protein [Candidatus Thermoplasmatota archaeon]MDH7506256.1 hypothetical protein [Candidatus Thermoplasmatota archaeon]